MLDAVTASLDTERCYRAVASRDARFDGWFFTAVRTTGIYCRPSCPARTPAAANVTFFGTAAGAQSAGFRACRRCRPDAVPGSPEWDVRADVVARAMRLIADGEVERAGVPGLAARLGYSERQVHRLLAGELGVGPLAVAREPVRRSPVGVVAKTSRTVSLNWRMLANPAANAMSAIGRSVVSMSTRAVCARCARASARAPTPSSPTSCRCSCRSE